MVFDIHVLRQIQIAQPAVTNVATWFHIRDMTQLREQTRASCNT